MNDTDQQSLAPPRRIGRFDYRVEEASGPFTQWNFVASFEGRDIGWLEIAPAGYGWRISSVSVASHQQRRGVASELLYFAREVLGHVRHGCITTPEAEAWAEVVG